MANGGNKCRQNIDLIVILKLCKTKTSIFAANLADINLHEVLLYLKGAFCIKSNLHHQKTSVGARLFFRKSIRLSATAVLVKNIPPQRN